MEIFEDKLTMLKDIVNQLESGNISLDESLQQFETGTRLIKDCHKQLEEFKKKVSLLVKNSGGEIEFKDFETDKE